MARTARWRSRRWSALAVRLLVFVVPLACGLLAAIVVASVIPGHSGVVGAIMWWAVVLGASFIAVHYSDKIARRFLPLARWLDLSLAFPGEAPSRIKTAGKTRTTAELQERIREVRTAGIDSDPAKAGETLFALVAALSVHEHVTRGHAERTGRLTDRLARKLGVSADERAKLRWTSLLHDIGKLKVSDEVLNKTEGLTGAEWEDIKRHTEFGDELLSPFKGFLAPWADTVAQHHESWDGTGYPQGLIGEEINLGARIVAVAEAYDAMTDRHSYRPTLTAREALREIKRSGGSQFDPAVVRAFLGHPARRLLLTRPVAALADNPFLSDVRRVAGWAGTAILGTVLVAAAVLGGVVSPRTESPNAPIAAPEVAPGDAVPGDVEGTIVAGLPEPNQGASGATTSTSTSTPTTTVVQVATTTTTTIVQVATTTTTTEPPPTTTTTEPPPTTTTTEPPPTTTTTEPPPTTTTTSPPPTTTTTSPPPTTTTTSPPPTTTTTSPPPTTTTTSPPPTTTTTAAPDNNPPVAVDDTVSGSADSTFYIAVLSNDSDPDGDTLELVACWTSFQGVTVAKSGNECVYEHNNPDFWSWPDMFFYSISDGNGGTDVALVTVTPS